MSDSLPKKPLARILSQRTEKAFGIKDSALPYVGLEHLDSGRSWLTRTAHSCTSTSLNSVFYEGDVLFGKLRPYLRKSASADRRGYCSTDILVLRPKDAMEPRFVSGLFQSEQLVRYAVATSMGTKMPRTSWRSLRELALFCPPLPEQQRIAEVLDTVDEVTRKTEEVIAKLQQMKQGLLHDLLTRGIDDNGELRDPDRHPEQFKDSKLGRIPRDWKSSFLGTLADIVRGSTPRPAKDPRYFDGSYAPWITVGQLSKSTWPYLEKPESYLTELGSRFSRRISAGTVVLSNSGFGCGVPKILAFDGFANDGIAAFLKLDPSVSPLFLFYYLTSRTLWLRRVVARGNDQPNLNTDLISSVSAPIPCGDEQERIATTIYAMDTRVRKEEVALTKLRLVNTALSDDLLTGRVRVPLPEDPTP